MARVPRWLMRTVAFFPIVFLFLPSCIPSTFVTVPAVCGRVVGPDAVPIPNATVRITHSRSHTEVATLTTGADGRFSRPPTSRFFLCIPGTDFYFIPYDVTAVAGPHVSAPAHFGSEVHVFSIGPSKTPRDLGDFVIPVSPVPATRRTFARPNTAAAARAAMPSPATRPAAPPAHDPDPELTAWVADNAPDKLYPPGTLRAEILRRFPHPRLKGGTRVHDVYHRSPFGVGRPVGLGLPVEVRARAVLYDDFDVIRLIGSAQLVFVDRVLYDADGRVLGTERHYAR